MSSSPSLNQATDSLPTATQTRNFFASLQGIDEIRRSIADYRSVHGPYFTNTLTRFVDGINDNLKEIKNQIMIDREVFVGDTAELVELRSKVIDFKLNNKENLSPQVHQFLGQAVGALNVMVDSRLSGQATKYEEDKNKITEEDKKSASEIAALLVNFAMMAPSPLFAGIPTMNYKCPCTICKVREEVEKRHPKE